MQLLLIYHMKVFEANLTVYLQRHLQLKKKRGEDTSAWSQTCRSSSITMTAKIFVSRMLKPATGQVIRIFVFYR